MIGKRETEEMPFVTEWFRCDVCERSELEREHMIEDDLCHVCHFFQSADQELDWREMEYLSDMLKERAKELKSLPRWYIEEVGAAEPEAGNNGFQARDLDEAICMLKAVGQATNKTLVLLNQRHLRVAAWLGGRVWIAR